MLLALTYVCLEDPISFSEAFNILVDVPILFVVINTVGDIFIVEYMFFL